MASSRWQRWLERVLDWFYPSRCGVCGRFCDGAICPNCHAQWKLIVAPYCRWCGKPFDPLAKASPLCGLCLQGHYRFDGARSVVRYEGIGRETVHALKFHRKPRLAQPMGEGMAAVMRRALDSDDGLLPEAWQPPDLLVSVPLHRHTQRLRGYNQAALLAEAVGASLKIPVRTDLLVQVRPMKPQASLGAKERWENVKGAFTRPESRAGQNRRRSG